MENLESCLHYIAAFSQSVSHRASTGVYQRIERWNRFSSNALYDAGLTSLPSHFCNGKLLLVSPSATAILPMCVSVCVSVCMHALVSVTASGFVKWLRKLYTFRCILPYNFVVECYRWILIASRSSPPFKPKQWEQNQIKATNERREKHNHNNKNNQHSAHSLQLLRCTMHNVCGLE